MNLIEAEELCKATMQKHGVGHWKFRWTNHKTIAGRCLTQLWNKNPARSMGIVELSKPVTKASVKADVVDTIQHEVAHAITDPSTKDHGPEWKASCRITGAVPTASGRKPDVTLKGRYKGSCENGHSYYRHKKTDSITSPRNHYCPPCSAGMKKGERVYLTWVDTKTGQVLNSAKTSSWDEEVNKLIKQLSTSAKQPKVSPPKVQHTDHMPTEQSFARRFDQGYTSFDDVW